ncbi:MAG: PQQ-binding-like beta-propeller repeat protein [Actinomycetota bacterium]
MRIRGLTHATAHRLRRAWRRKLNGAVIASPLYASGLGGARQRILFVSTEAGSVYALRPDNGRVLWKRTFGVVTPAAGCGRWGISSTGAIDLKRLVLYVISADGWLHALALATGTEKPGWPIAITTAHSDGEYVWGGLRLFRNVLYVPVASYCDAAGSDGQRANGRLVGIDVDAAAQVSVFDPVPGEGNLGGIWGWGGVSVDPKGQALYTGVGNSYVYDPGCRCYQEDAGYGNSVVKLSPKLDVIDWGRPSEYPRTGDLDFGSAPLLFRPDRCPPLLAANSKVGTVFVWNRNGLAKEAFSRIPIGGQFAFIGQPSYSLTLRTIFVSGANLPWLPPRIGDGVAAFVVNRLCQFRLRWRAKVGSGTAPPPLIVGDVVFAAGGEGGGYAAFAARTGKTLWQFATSSATFAPPIAADGRIFAGDYSGRVHAFAR